MRDRCERWRDRQERKAEARERERERKKRRSVKRKREEKALKVLTSCFPIAVAYAIKSDKTKDESYA